MAMKVSKGYLGADQNLTTNNSFPPEIPPATHGTPNDSSMLEHLFNSLSLYLLPVIVLVGGVGNILSLYVILKTHLRHQSSNIYLAFLSIVDTGFLVFLFLVWIDFLEKNTIFPRNGFCQIIPYVTYVLGFLSVYTVVSFTVERFIITFHPLQRQTFCTTARAKMVVGGLLMFALVYYSFPLYMSTVVVHGDKRACVPKSHYMKAAWILSSIDTFLTLVLPSVIIISFNIAIIIKISSIFSHRNSLRLGRQFTRNTSQSSKNGVNTVGGVVFTRGEQCNSNESDRSLSRTVSLVQMTNKNPPRDGTTFHHSVQTRTTRTLLMLSTTFVVLNLPSHVLRVYMFIVSLAGTQLNQQQLKTIYAVQELVQFVYYINFASNFFLYTICSQSFREMARSVLWNRLANHMVSLRSRLMGQSQSDQSVLDHELDHLQGVVTSENIAASRS